MINEYIDRYVMLQAKDLVLYRALCVSCVLLTRNCHFIAWSRYVERAMDTAAQFRTSNETVAKGWTYTWLGFSFILDILLHCNETTVNSMPGRDH